MLQNNVMVTRRLLLGSAVTLVAMPALARPRRDDAHAGASKTGTPGQPAPPQDNTPAQTPIGPIATTARWAYIMDYNTGAVLLEKNANQEMTPSSLTKLMTMYIVFTRLAEGRLKLTDQLPVSATAWRMGGSKMFVRVGTTVSVLDLIKGVIVDSGNDACIVLAQAISGSQAQFADLMNQTAKQLGLTHSHFMNPMGWPVPDHYMTARDIAVLTADLIRRFPQYYHFFDDKTFTYSNITQNNRNALVMHGTADGLKTGHTEAGGYGLCVSAERNGRRVIVVLNGMPSSRQRAEQGQRLLDWAFANFEDATLYSAGEVVDHARVWLGTSPTVPLVGARNLVVTMPRNARNGAKVQISYDSPIRAPVAKGARLGTLTVVGQGVPSMQIPLLAGVSVAKLGLPGRALAVLTHYVTGS